MNDFTDVNDDEILMIFSVKVFNWDQMYILEILEYLQLLC